MEVSAEKSVSTDEKTLGVQQLDLPGLQRDYSSVHKRCFQWLFGDKETRLGYKSLSSEPDGGALGNTHRWTYAFYDRPKFCSYYWKKDGTMIRPSIEVWERQISPERPIQNIKDWVNILLCAAMENYGNQHVTNRIMHYLYDALWYQNNGYDTMEKAKELFLKRLQKFKNKTQSLVLQPQVLQMEGRLFYRFNNEVEDLEKDPVFIQQMHIWTKQVKQIRKLFNKEAKEGVDYYNVRRVMRSMQGKRSIIQMFKQGQSFQEGREHMVESLKSKYQSQDIRQLGVEKAMTKERELQRINRVCQTLQRQSDFSDEIASSRVNMKQIEEEDFSLEPEDLYQKILEDYETLFQGQDDMASFEGPGEFDNIFNLYGQQLSDYSTDVDDDTY